MTRKDFVMIADIINGLHRDDREVVAGAFAHRLKASNPAFDSERFINACMKENA